MDRILVCLDASPRATGVLATATDLARRAGGKLILFRAVGIPLEIPHEAYSMSPAALAEMLEADALKHVNLLAATVPEALLIEAIVETGNPWQTICRVANEKKCDLIMIGSHGYSGLDKLMGTTAAKVVNHATQSVLVVRH
ncbi:MAG: universal stress protein [Minicystis sp.]